MAELRGAAALTAAQCPICMQRRAVHSILPDQVWRARRFVNLDCRACRTTFLDPMPDEAEIPAIYTKGDYHDLFYGETEEAADHGRSLDLLRDWVGAGASLLDFGCGGGSFLAAARKAGFAAAGVEIDPGAIRMAQDASGCPVSTLEAIEREGRTFDVIRLGDVLEHLPGPEATMRRLEPRLAEGGCFMIEGPLENNPSPVYAAILAFAALKRALGRDRPSTAAPTHLFRTAAPAQRAFFEKRLGLTARIWTVYETGWPYLAAGQPVRWPRSWLKHAIAALALAVGGRRLGGVTFGNRFTGLFSRRGPAEASPGNGRRFDPARSHPPGA